MTARTVLSAIAMVAMTSCVRPTQFDRYLADQRWTDAAREFAADPSLRENEHALYQAALLFGIPGRSTYDPARSRGLFTTLLARFPNSKYASDARGHIILIDDAMRARSTADAQQHELESRIETLMHEMAALRTRIDSTAVVSDSLRAMVVRLEAERHDRDEQLKALKLELQRLKDIDLKPRPPIKP